MGMQYLDSCERILGNRYDILNIQEIWNSDIENQKKEELYRNAIDDSDLLLNIYTGRFFWAKASYAYLKKKKIITIYTGEDVKKIFIGNNGFLGHVQLDGIGGISRDIVCSLQVLGMHPRFISFNKNYSGDVSLLEFVDEVIA